MQGKWSQGWTTILDRACFETVFESRDKRSGWHSKAVGSILRCMHIEWNGNQFWLSRATSNFKSVREPELRVFNPSGSLSHLPCLKKPADNDGWVLLVPSLPLKLDGDALILVSHNNGALDLRAWTWNCVDVVRCCMSTNEKKTASDAWCVARHLVKRSTEEALKGAQPRKMSPFRVMISKGDSAACHLVSCLSLAVHWDHNFASSLCSFAPNLVTNWSWIRKLRLNGTNKNIEYINNDCLWLALPLRATLFLTILFLVQKGKNRVGC